MQRILLLATLYLFLAFVAHATGKPELADSSDGSADPRPAGVASVKQAPQPRQVRVPRSDVGAVGRQPHVTQNLQGTQQHR